MRRTCFNVALFIDARGGTGGGGIFRYMYARFLKEAAAIIEDTRLDDLSTELTHIGDLWEDVAATFTQASEASDPAKFLEAATEPMRSIADREEDLWERLADVASS